MNSEKRISVAFVLNLIFSLAEVIGGILTGSTAILSDALHDLGDGISIGIAFLLEKKSKQPADGVYTFGYGRYGLLGAVLTNGILCLGAVTVLCGAVGRMLHPGEVKSGGMLLLSIFGITVNLAAVLLTKKGESLNQKAVNLHMLEDVLSWSAVFVAALVIRFTNFHLLDPLLSLAISLWTLFHGFKGLWKALPFFLEAKPEALSVEEIKNRLEWEETICAVEEIHLWSIDGIEHWGCLRLLVCTEQPNRLKKELREILHAMGLSHVLLELEHQSPSEPFLLEKRSGTEERRERET